MSHDWDSKLNPPDIHEEDGCGDRCHSTHVYENKIVKGCYSCEDIQCVVCKGSGNKDGGDCLNCNATGIDPTIQKIRTDRMIHRWIEDAKAKKAFEDARGDR